MSDETKAALDAAIQAHIQDDGDALLVEYVLHARWVSGDVLEANSNGYFAEYSDHIPRHSAIGLARLLLTRLERPEEDD